MAQSASNIFIDNSGPTDPSQIVAGTIVTTLGTFGSCTIHYEKVGNLYFGIWFLNGGGLSVLFDTGSDTTTALESIFGITINTLYAGQSYGAYLADHNGGNWNGTPPNNNTRNIILGFLSN